MYWLTAVTILTLTGCGMPKDPADSFDKAEREGLHVGIVENPPYTIHRGEEWEGREVALVDEFARMNDLDVQYIEGTESHLIDQLQHYNLQLVIGGFEKNTAWKGEAGLTIPYDHQHVLLVPKGENGLLYKLEHFLMERGIDK